MPHRPTICVIDAPHEDPAASGGAPVRPGYPRIAAYLCVADAAEAISWYGEVFGATERLRIPMADGRLGHAEIEIDGSVVMLSDAFPEMGVVTPADLGGSPVALNVYVGDPDAVHAAALADGATEIRPVEDQFHGDRSGQFVDPFGHRWAVARHIEDVAPEEILRRARELFDDG